MLEKSCQKQSELDRSFDHSFEGVFEMAEGEEVVSEVSADRTVE